MDHSGYAEVDPAAAAFDASADPDKTWPSDLTAAMIALVPEIFGPAPGSDSAFVPPPRYNNGHANGSLLDLKSRAADVASATTNGKLQGEHDMDDDDDSGAEAASGGVALDVKHGPATQQKPSSNPFSDDLAEELQRQQTQEFDPEGEPARDTPTPPADEVPGAIGLVSDNVAESGEESEDEWNYYKVEPTGKSSESEKQTKEEVCQRDQPEDNEENPEDMESQLNPDAAEFIPSPTHSRPSMEEFILSQGKIDTSMDDLIVPSSSEFEKEVSTRPSDVAFENSFFNSSLSSVNSSSLLEKEERGLADTSSEFTVTEQTAFVNPHALEQGLPNILEVSATLNESEFSTKAQFGDESTTSFMTMESDFQRVAGENGETESSETLQESVKFRPTPVGEPTLQETVLENIKVVGEETTFQETVNDFQKEPVHISFELHKEIAPHMESQPERVKVDSVDDSPIESEMKVINDLPVESSEGDVFMEKIPESLEFENQELVTARNEEKVFDDFLHETVNRESGSNKTQDIQNEKTEELSPKMENFDTDFSKPLVDVQQTIFHTVEESQVLMATNKTESESFVDDFRENLSIQKESLNLNNEMSTPEYEKLEKVVEASEALMDQINMSRKDLEAESFFSEQRQIETEHVQDVILESAHPDKTQLLVDTCAEILSPIPDNSVNVVMDSEAVNDLVESLSSEKLPSSDLGLSETPTVDLMLQASEQIQEVSYLPSEETSNEPAADINSEGLPIVEIPQIENLLETTQTPPPTPAVSQVVEPLNFNVEVDNFAQVIEKLSVADQPLPERLTEERNLDAEVPASSVELVEAGVLSVHEPVGVMESEVPSAEIIVSNVTEAKAQQVIDQSSIAATEIAGAAVATTTAAAAAAAAVVVVAAAAATNEDLKKETESSAKKTPSTSVTKKSITERVKGAAEKSKASSAERPKTAAKTTTSKLTSATKTKSPTSPVKSPVAAKAAPRPSPVPTTKPTSKVPPATKTSTSTAKALSSTTGTSNTTTTSRTKPATTQPLTKPAVPRTSSLKRPTTTPPTTEKKPLTNGDLRTAPKRPEQLATKSSLRPASRPATAPAARTITKTLVKDSKDSKDSTVTKTSLNGPSRPRPLSSVTPRTTSKPSTDKETKESANKQISTRTTTASSTIRSSMTSSTKPSALSAPRKIESKPLTNGRSPMSKQTSSVKSSTASKVPPKRPATATRLKSTKTTVLVEKSETVQGSKTVVTTNEVKSEVVLDNTQPAA